MQENKGFFKFSQTSLLLHLDKYNMIIFEDILDDLTAIDSKAKQIAVSDSDKLYDPMDVEQFEVLLRFNVFYDIYLTKAQQVRRIK